MVPSHYFKHNRLIVHLTLRNKLQWKLNQNDQLFRAVKCTQLSSAKCGPSCSSLKHMASALHGSHYSDVIMSAMASQITSLTIVYSSVYSGADQWKHQSSASLAFVRIIHRWPVNSPHKGPVTRKMFPFDDVIMQTLLTGFQMIDWKRSLEAKCFKSLNSTEQCRRDYDK